MLRFYKHEEEKNKVGRPKLADDETKKKAIISVCVALVLVITLALTGAFKLNIIKFNKLKGTVNVNLCFEIPAEFQPGGNYEYGFTDPKFYSAVVSTYNSDSSYCSTITEEQLKSIINFSYNGYNNPIDNTEGVQYLTGLKSLELISNNLSSIDVSNNLSLEYLRLSNNNIGSIDLSKNTKLKTLFLTSNNLSSIDVSHNIVLTNLYLSSNNIDSIDVSENTLLNTLWLDGNNLSSIDVSENVELTSLELNRNNLSNIDIGQNIVLENLQLANNNLSSIDVSKNVALRSLHLYDNNLTSIDLSQNPALIILYLERNKLTSIDLSNNTNLTSLDLSSNNFNKTYTTIENSIILDEPNVITSYKNDTIYSINNPSIATYNNGIVKRVNPGFATLKVNYKVSEFKSFEVNYGILFIGLSSSEYKIDYENKIIDAKGDVFKKSKVQINSNLYKLNVNGNKLEILNSDKNVVDTYEIINEREKVDDAYLKAGFKDKNLYTCVVKSYFNDDGIEGNYLLSDEEMQNIDELYCINQNVNDTTGIEKLTNLEGLYLSYNNIEKIDLSNNTNLYGLVLGNNKLTSLDVSKNINLQQIDIQHNNINKIIGLENLEELSVLIAYNNNLSNLDISKNINLAALMISNNPLSNTLYMLREKEIDYKKDIKLNEAYEIKSDVVDTNIVSYKDNKLKALKEGITNIYLSNEYIMNATTDYYDKVMKCEFLQDEKACEVLENINEEDVILPYFLSQEIKVYDITSEVYKVDKEKKTIDASGLDLDISKIKITLDGLSATVKEDNFIIKDGETIVDTYKILNMKKVVDKPGNSSNNKITTTKKNGSNSKTTTKKKTTTTEDLSDIEINGSFVSMLALQQVKGTDRNIVVKNDGITITINGKDIDKVNGNLDLSYELKTLKNTPIYEDVKDKVKNGMVLRFKDNNDLPGKILVSLDVTDNIKKNIGTKDLYLYNYDLEKMILVADKINVDNNKLSFYINKQGNYVLTNKELNKKHVDIDFSMYKENTDLSKSIINKKLIIPIIIFILLIILGIIGYVRYKKKK